MSSFVKEAQPTVGASVLAEGDHHGHRVIQDVPGGDLRHARLIGVDDERGHARPHDECQDARVVGSCPAPTPLYHPSEEPQSTRALGEAFAP
jgi:hypothetical protein